MEPIVQPMEPAITAPGAVKSRTNPYEARQFRGLRIKRTTFSAGADSCRPTRDRSLAAGGAGITLFALLAQFGPTLLVGADWIERVADLLPVAGTTGRLLSVSFTVARTLQPLVAVGTTMLDGGSLEAFDVLLLAAGLLRTLVDTTLVVVGTVAGAALAHERPDDETSRGESNAGASRSDWTQAESGTAASERSSSPP